MSYKRSTGHYATTTHLDGLIYVNTKSKVVIPFWPLGCNEERIVVSFVSLGITFLANDGTEARCVYA